MLSTAASSLYATTVSPHLDPRSTPEQVVDHSSNITVSVTTQVCLSKRNHKYTHNFFAHNASELKSSFHLPLLHDRQGGSTVIFQCTLEISNFRYYSTGAYAVHSITASSKPSNVDDITEYAVLCQQLLVIYTSEPTTLEISIRPLVLSHRKAKTLVLFLVVRRTPLTLDNWGRLKWTRGPRKFRP